MMAGATPFKSANRDVLLTRISNQTVKYPRNFPHLAIDLIDKMLCKNP